jgi:hypothetical protein
LRIKLFLPLLVRLSDDHDTMIAQAVFERLTLSRTVEGSASDPLNRPPRTALAHRENNIVGPFFFESSRQLKLYWVSLEVQGSE